MKSDNGIHEAFACVLLAIAKASVPLFHDIIRNRAREIRKNGAPALMVDSFWYRHSGSARYTTPEVYSQREVHTMFSRSTLPFRRYLAPTKRLLTTIESEVSAEAKKSAKKASKLDSLPPEVRRELARHVSAKPIKDGDARKGQNKVSPILIACLSLTAAAASLPVVIHWWLGGSLNEKDAPLTAPQVRRGAFLNSGTRDIGKDPNWDFSTGQYKKPTGYAAIEGAGGGGNNRLPGQYHATQALSKAQEQAMLDFAQGKVNPRRERRLRELQGNREDEE